MLQLIFQYFKRQFLTKINFFLLNFFKQITELKPATSYVFLVRAENSYGLSMPSPLSSAIKTLGTDKSIVPPSELAAARMFLSGKVSKLMNILLYCGGCDVIYGRDIVVFFFFSFKFS